MSARGEPVGAAVIGLGVGEEHARALIGTGRCDVRWLCDLSLDRAEDAAARLGTGQATASYQQILEDEGTDLVCIASYDDAHFSQVMDALQARKHVFVEKPLCRTLDELRAIADAWGEHKGHVKLASNLVLRSAPLYRWLKEQASEGALGSLYAVDGDYLYGRLPKLTEGWRGSVDNYSPMLGGGIHLVDLVLWITGQRPTSVIVDGNRLCSEGSAYRYLDFMAAQMTFPTGLVARVSANFGCVHRHQHVLRVFGSRATFVSDDAGARLHLERDPGRTDDVQLAPLPLTKGALLPALVDAITTDGDMSTTTQELFDGISVCVACDESARSGNRVEVTYV